MSLQTEKSSMRFGVNYTPREGWFHSWLDFDPGKVRADLEQIASLGVDHIRVFPLWPLLQPNRSLIRSQAIDDVGTVVQIAHECGLDTTVDVLQGHLSSFDFLPSWVTSWHEVNVFTDEAAVSAESQLILTLGKALRELPGFSGLSLGNEFIQFAAPRHPQSQKITHEQAQKWLETLLSQAQRVAPGKIHTFSHDDDIWFDSQHPFVPGDAVQFGDNITVHSWIFGTVAPHYGKSAVELTWFARYLCELADAWARAYGIAPRPIWLQEVGAPEHWIEREDIPQFVRDTMLNLRGDSSCGLSPNLRAITWWCSHDVNSDLADFPHFEHSLGLFDQHGAVKPVGQAFAAAIREWGNPDPAHSRESQEIELGTHNRQLLNADQDFFANWVRWARGGQVKRIDIKLAED